MTKPLDNQKGAALNLFGTKKQFSVFGYAVNFRGYTCSAKVCVFAIDREQAVTRAAAQLRWDRMTHFTAVTVTEISPSTISVKGETL